MTNFLPFDENGSQKIYTNGGFLTSVLGIPNSFGGFDRRNQLMWNKNGVALAYMLVPTLKSAVDVISTNLSSVPMYLKDEKGNVVHRSDMSGAAQNKFLKAIESSYKYYGIPLFQLWATSLLLYGECVIEKVPDTFGNYVSMKWLNPLATQINVEVAEDTSNRLLLNGNRRFYERRTFLYSGKFESVTFSDDEVLFSRSYNPIDDIRGYSDALAALSKANITMEFENFTLAFYSNNGHPGLIISPRDKLVNEKQVREWQRDWESKFRGSNEQFKTHISGFPFDVQTFDIPDISKPLDVSKDAEIKILRSFKVSPEMIGDTTENSYQFSKETKNSFMQTVVRPLGLSISNCINHSGIISQFDGVDSNLKFGFDFSEFENVAKSDLDKQDVLERRLKSGGISVGAYQRALGAEVVEGTDDVFLVPQGFLIVKSDSIANPETLPEQPKDQRGFDSSSFNQSDRRTQSVTEDQETTDFYSSKYFEDMPLNDQKGLFSALFEDDGVDVHDTTEKALKSIPNKYMHINFNPPDGVRQAAKRALEWMSEGHAGEGFTDVGRKRASDLSDGNYQPSPEVVKRMYSYLSRHQPDKKAEGFNSGEKGFPSPGRVAYDAWGGEPAYTWSSKVVNQMEKSDSNETRKNLTLQKISELSLEGKIDVEEALNILMDFEDDL